MICFTELWSCFKRAAHANVFIFSRIFSSLTFISRKGLGVFGKGPWSSLV